MSGDVELELYLHEYKMTALSSVLEEQGSSVEKRMQEMLIDLYAELVPYKVQQEIRERIDAECAAWEVEQEAARKYTLFCVRENGTERFYQLDHSETFLDIAKFLRSYLRKEQTPPTAALKKFLRDLKPVSDGQYSRMLISHVENTGKVTGVFEMDFDRREVSAFDAGGIWRTYSMKDVSSAVYFAYRKSSLPLAQYGARFEDGLRDKAHVPTGRLPAKGISFTDEIYEMDGLLNFCMEPDFNTEEVFGAQISAAQGGGWVNIYANYDMAAEQVCGTLDAALHCGDGSDKELCYSLKPVERALLLRKMEDYCQQQTGQTLAEYSAQLMAEGIAPPAQPTM